MNKPTLKKLVTAACAGLAGVSAAALLDALSQQDISDFSGVGNLPLFLREMASASSLTEHLSHGVRPPEWNARAHCGGCGDVWLWAAVSVPTCPWCEARKDGVKIPRPAKVGA